MQPTAVTRDRIEELLKSNSWYYWLDNDGDLGGQWCDNTFSFMLRGDSKEVLIITGRYHTPLTMDQLSLVRAHIVDWHRDKLWPKCYHRIDDGGRMRVFTEVSLAHDRGVTDDQLMDHISCALSTSNQFFDTLTEALRS